MAGTIKTTTKNCTESFSTTYSTAGTPFTTATIFTKTFTSNSGFVFITPPTIDFSKTTNPGSYSFTVVDTPTNGVANKNLTSRAFTVNYTYSLSQPVGDVVKFFSRAIRSFSDTTTSIYGYDLKTSSIRQGGEKRDLLVYGDAGVSLTVQAKLTGGANLNSSTSQVSVASSSSTIVKLVYSNSKIRVGMSVTGTNVGSGVTVAAISGKTLTLSAAKSLTINTIITIGASGSFTATLDGNGKFVLPLFFPRVSSAANYTITLTEIASGSFVNLTTPTAIIIYQYINTTTTLSTAQTGTNFLLSGTNIAKTAAGNTIKQTADNFVFYVTSNAAAGANAAGTATIRPLKAVGTLGTEDLTGVKSTSSRGVVGSNSSDISLIDLESSLSQGTTRTTSGSSSTAAITLSSANTAIKVGMKVTGTNISNAVVVSSISGTTLVLSGAPGGTVGNGTTLTFNPVGVIQGIFRINKFGTANDTVSFLTNNVFALNEAPVAVSVAAQSIPSNDPVTIALGATDAESDGLIYIITQLPLTVSGNAAHGTLKHGDDNTAISSVPTVLPSGTKSVKYTKVANSTTATDFKFKVNDGFQNSNVATIVMNLTN